MAKSTVTHNDGTQTPFKPGAIVVAHKCRLDERIVLVTANLPGENFAGVALNEEDFGAYSDRWAKHLFVPFHGKIELEVE